MELGQFLEAQRSQGAEDGEGAFSIDINAAAKKLREHQLPSPSHYLLKAVQTAVSAGSPSVDITRERFRTAISFVVPMESPLTDIEHLTRVLADPLRAQDPCLKHFMGAVGGILSTEHAQVSFLLESSQRKLELCLSPKIEVHETSTTGNPEESRCRCTLVREQRRRFWKALSIMKERATEARILAQNCAQSPIPVRLDTRSLADTWDPRFSHAGNRRLPGEEYSAFAHYIVGEQKLLAQTLPTRSYEKKEDIHLWKGALWGINDDTLPQGLATTYGLAFLDETGRAQNLRLGCRMLFSRVLVLDISLSGPTHFFPIHDGVALNGIKRERYPGLSVLGWEPSLSVDLSGFSVVQDTALSDFLNSLHPQYQQLLEHTYEIRDLIKRTHHNTDQSQNLPGWGNTFNLLIEKLKLQYSNPQSKDL